MSLAIPNTEDAGWRPLYDHARRLDYGASLTYESINDLVGFDVRDNRWPVYRVDLELQRADHKALENVRGVGYAIARPEGHLTLVRQKVKRSQRQAKKGSRIAAATRLDLIEDQATRNAIVGIQARLEVHAAQLRMLNRRQEEQAEVLAVIQPKQDDMDERVRKLEELLANRQV